MATTRGSGRIRKGGAAINGATGRKKNPAKRLRPTNDEESEGEGEERGPKAAAAKKGKRTASKKGRDRKKPNLFASDDSDEEMAPSDMEEGSNVNPTTKRGGKKKGKPTIEDALANTPRARRNTSLHQLVADIQAGVAGAEEELLGTLIESKFTALLVMVPGSPFPQLAHSLYQYNSRQSRQGDENHSDFVMFIGNRTARGDPPGFIVVDKSFVSELQEVECLDDDEGIAEFIQNSKNDGKLLCQRDTVRASTSLEKKKILCMLPVNDEVAEYVAINSPSHFDLDEWANHEDNNAISDEETDQLNEWQKAAVLTDDAESKQKKSSIIAHPFLPIIGASDEFLVSMGERLDCTLGRAPEPAEPQSDSRGATMEWREQERLRDERQRLEDAKKLAADKDKWSDGKWARWCGWSGVGHKDDCSSTLKKLADTRDPDDALSILQNGFAKKAFNLRARLTNDQVTEEIVKALMKGQPTPTGASMVPTEGQIPKILGHMQCVLMTPAQRDEMYRQKDAERQSAHNRTFEEALTLASKQISGKLMRRPPSSYRESVQVYEDALIWAATILTEKSELTQLYEEINSVLRLIARFAHDIPAETWITLSAYVFYDEAQFFATRTTEGDVIDDDNLPRCTTITAGILQQLATCRTVPPLHNPLPLWKTHTKQNNRRETERDRRGGGDRDRDFTHEYDTNVQPEVKTLMKDYWKTYRQIKVGQICDDAGIKIADLPESFKGKCFNKFLGKCNRYRCKHSHDFSDIPSADVTEFCKLVEPGIKEAAKVKGGSRR